MVRKIMKGLVPESYHQH